MSLLRCKLCGGTLELIPGKSVAVCEYCGSAQTVPNIDDEKKVALFDRANSYRANNEFDKAAVIYESIVSEVPGNAEARWGLCLCRYGIEYVVDPRSNKRIPTCHRTQFRSIPQDPDYLAAINNADPEAREIYISEATYIDKVQKNILSISSKEEPYDIFICYKETDDFGDRTVDSVIAQEIYDALTEVGYKVFFARITLEDKLGIAYEPYIFAALNSAPLMLVLGSKKEYFNAVWVKNEWGRFLSMIEQGQKKTVIPCYKNISVSEMPAEFAALQAQDVSKVGWKQDLVRGIGKILPLERYADAKVPERPTEAVPDLPSDTVWVSIKTIQSRGATNSNELWPTNSPISSTINMDRYPCVSLQNILASPAPTNGTILLKFTVYDDLNNIIYRSESPVHVNRGNDKIGQVWILKGDDGSRVNEGNYRAVFSINRGPEVGYNFRVISDSTVPVGYNTPYAAHTPNVYPDESVLLQKDRAPQKKLGIYLILCVIFGTLGVHSFYAGRKAKGVIQLILTVTAVGVYISFIWVIFDFFRALFTRRVPVKK